MTLREVILNKIQKLKEHYTNLEMSLNEVFMSHKLQKKRIDPIGMESLVNEMVITERLLDELCLLVSLADKD